MKTALFVALAIVCGAALAHDIDPNDAGAIRNAVAVQDDPYSAAIVYAGPQVDYTFDSHAFLVPNDKVVTNIKVYCLRKAQYCSSSVIVDVRYSGDDWRFINNAELLGGVELKITPIVHSVIDCDGTCDYEEAVRVDLPDGFLAAHAKDGFKLRVGIREYSFTAAYVQGMIAASTPPTVPAPVAQR